jgi:hypothetical protein
MAKAWATSWRWMRPAQDSFSRVTELIAASMASQQPESVKIAWQTFSRKASPLAVVSVSGVEVVWFDIVDLWGLLPNPKANRLFPFSPTRLVRQVPSCNKFRRRSSRLLVVNGNGIPKNAKRLSCDSRPAF